MKLNAAQISTLKIIASFGKEGCPNMVEREGYFYIQVPTLIDLGFVRTREGFRFVTAAGLALLAE